MIFISTFICLFSISWSILPTVCQFHESFERTLFYWASYCVFVFYSVNFLFLFPFFYFFSFIFFYSFPYFWLFKFNPLIFTHYFSCKYFVYKFINFLFYSTLIEFHIFWHVVFIILLWYSLMFIVILSLTCQLFRTVFLNFHLFEYFSGHLFVIDYLSCFLVIQCHMQNINLFSEICWDLSHSTIILKFL